MAGMTISQKILAVHAGKDFAEPGELINCKLDIVLGNDVTTPVAIPEFEKLGRKEVFDREQRY
jgi:3-isopropylmalate/(R)-2-methylmalate dehydratase large subunit